MRAVNTVNKADWWSEGQGILMILNHVLQVILNSDDEIQLSSSDIAKAFHILRKYRYTFTSPEHRPTFICNEAEIPMKSAKVSHKKKSLPYLDLAEGSKTRAHKSPAKFDWVDSFSPAGAMRQPSVTTCVAEWPITDFCLSQPILQQVIIGGNYGNNDLSNYQPRQQ